MKLKQYKKKTIGSYFAREIIFIVTAFLMSILIIEKFYHNFNDVIYGYAESKAKKYISMIINDATNGIKFDSNLFTIEKSSDNEIKMVTYDSYEATKLINEITYNIQRKLDDLENNIDSNGNSKFVVFKIPVGIIFKNSALRNFGPKVNVRLDIMGDILSELQTEVKPYGINNALVEVRVNITANMRLVLPLKSEEIQVKNIIPISINIVNGNIPDIYIGTYK